MIFEFQEEPHQEDLHILLKGLNEQAAQKKSMGPMKPLAFFIKDPEGIVLGGINGVTYYGCLYIDMVWVKESVRQQGFGAKLMQEVETAARNRGCTFSTVNTMDWEALPFYQKQGYQIEFIREGYEKNSKMFMLRKKL